METVKHEKIMIVEDDQRTQDALKRKLADLGYEVLSVQSEHKDFWKQAFDENVGLIIVDVRLKNRISAEVYRQLLGFEQSRTIPVLFISGLAEEAPAEHPPLRDENYAFFEEPVDFERLYQEMGHLLHEPYINRRVA